MRTPLRLLKGIHSIPAVVDMLLEDESLRLPTKDDISDIKKLLSSKGVTNGTLLLNFNHTAWFAPVYVIVSGKIDIASTNRRDFVIIIYNEY